MNNNNLNQGQTAVPNGQNPQVVPNANTTSTPNPTPASTNASVKPSTPVEQVSADTATTPATNSTINNATPASTPVQNVQSQATPVGQAPVQNVQPVDPNTAQTTNTGTVNSNNLQSVPTVDQSKEQFINNTQGVNKDDKPEKKSNINVVFVVIIFVVIILAIIFLFPYLLKNF